MVAEVVVNIFNSNTDKVYDYLLPSEKNIQVGSRVYVPFANRKIEGLVVRIKEQSNYPIDKLKSVLWQIDSSPIISEELVNLMWYMHDEFHMLFADIITLFAPSELRKGTTKEKIVYAVELAIEHEQIVKAGKALSVLQNDVYQYLISANCKITKASLVNKFSASPINTLIKRGIFVQCDEKVQRIPYKELNVGEKKAVNLTCEQVNAIDKITLGLNVGGKFLLHGVTGSGKTEVYLNIISECIKNNKTAIMLVPEISLTPQMSLALKSKFGNDVAILHSRLSAGERFDEWWRLKTGEAKIAIGARSAVFAPVENIGVIIVDEEHDSSYVAENGKFATKAVAEFRCDYNKAALVLGSATPSVETFYKTEQKEYELISLPNRVNAKPLPNINIVDMRDELKAGNKSIFSRELITKLEECIQNKNQAMLFINRRGFSQTVICKECGYVAKCDDCDVALTFHKEENALKCHYCSGRYKMLETCPKCQSPYINLRGLGTEKVVHELLEMFPNVRVLRMDNDTTQNKEGHLKIVQEFSNNNADILVGTQMITKGHDFKDVALVGILDADLSLYFSDYRSSERTFQLITQVSGRAGRADVEGNVVLQTYSPNHYIYALAKKGDYKNFYLREIALRKATHYPPFSHIVRIIFQSEDENTTIENLKEVYLKTLELKKQNDSVFIYLNKMKAPLKKLQKKHRFQILMRLTMENSRNIIDKLFELCAECKVKNVTSYVEVNPQNMF